MLGLLFSALVIALGAWLLSRNGDRSFFVSGDTLPRLTATRIYCLDCAAPHNSLLPRYTFLTSEARCAKCYGRSYVLAAVWAPRFKEVIQREFRSKLARERTRIIERKVKA